MKNTVPDDASELFSTVELLIPVDDHSRLVAFSRRWGMSATERMRRAVVLYCLLDGPDPGSITNEIVIRNLNTNSEEVIRMY